MILTIIVLLSFLLAILIYITHSQKNDLGLMGVNIMFLILGLLILTQGITYQDYKTMNATTTNVSNETQTITTVSPHFSSLTPLLSNSLGLILALVGITGMFIPLVKR